MRYYNAPRRLGLLLAVATAGLTGSSASAAEEAPATPSSAVMHLTDGSFIPGTLGDTARPGVLRWQAAAFVSPFEFPVDRVNAVHWPPPALIPKPEGDLCFELAGGDVVFGSLVSLDDQARRARHSADWPITSRSLDPSSNLSLARQR